MKRHLTLIILQYFRLLARLQLRKNPRATVIGVTGSVGKTSTRRLIATILASRGKVKETHKANSESGIPLNILGLRPRTYSPFDWLLLAVLAPLKLLTNWERFRYYVVEMGVDSPHPPKNMGHLLTIIKPDVGLVLNAHPVHSAYFDHLVVDRDPARRQEKLTALIAQEKGRLVTSMTPQNIAILNADEHDVAALALHTPARLLTFGKEGHDLRIRNVRQTKQAFTMELLYHGTVYPFELKGVVLDPNYAYTIAAAVAAAVAVGIPVRKSLDILAASFPIPPGRFRLFGGLNGSTILDSSYNASPTSMFHALKVLHTVGRGTRKIAVLGDMRELGLTTKQAHKDLAEWIGQYVDEAFLYGPETGRYTFPILVKRGAKAAHFTRMADLIAALKPALTKGAFVLFKGSQNTILLERAVEAVLSNPADRAKLCRRGAFWDRARSAAL